MAKKWGEEWMGTLTDDNSSGCSASVSGGVHGCVKHCVILNNCSIHFVSLQYRITQKYTSAGKGTRIEIQYHSILGGYEPST